MRDEQQQRVIEATALRWLARLPLLREEDFALLMDEHEVDTRGALQTLMRCGWIERVRLHSPEMPEHPRYLVRSEAVKSFAAAFGIDGDELRHWPIGRRENLAHITHFAITDCLNGLLVSLAQNVCDTLYEVADLRMLPHARRSAVSWYPALTDAFGCLRRGAYVANFFVAWDREAAPTVHRRARVRAWYDAFEAANYWGEYRLPPILLVLPSRGLDAEWQHLLEAAARRRDVADLDVFVAADDEASGEVIRGTWRRLGEEDTTSLLQLLHLQRTEPPVEVPTNARFDLIARGVPVSKPTLHNWAGEALQRDTARVTERVAALSLQLEARHREVRNLLARHPLLGVEEIAGRMGVSAVLVQRVLRDLERHGLVGRLEVSA